MLYGIATTNNSPVIFDPFDASLLNANEVVFAKSAGKSYATKVKALRFLQRGVGFLVVDPEDEYRAVCEAVDGQYLRLASSSPHKLNPFDLPPPDPTADEGRDPLAEQVAAVLGSVARGDAGSTPAARSARASGPSWIGPSTWPTRPGDRRRPGHHGRPPPLMRDLLGELDALAEDDRDAEDLADRLRRYVEGSLAGLFGGPTNVALDRRFVVFNVQALEEELRPIGIHLIANFVWTLVRREKKPRLLVVDEAWTLMQYEAGGSSSMAARAASTTSASSRSPRTWPTSSNPSTAARS